MNIIITGSEGFIGNNLLKKIKHKYKVYEINEDIFNSQEWVTNLKKTLDQVKPSVIFHIGACSDTMEKDVQFMMIRNFESTKIISDFCYENNVPMVYSSSAANYGENNQYPSNLYGWSKYVAEKYVISNGGIALRYFNVYGPGEESKGVMSSIAYQMFIKNKLKEEIKLFPNRPTRDFVYVNDVVDANIFAYDKYEELCGKYYDVGSGQSRSFEDVLNLMNIEYQYHLESMIPKGYQYYTCSDKNKWMNGWKPKYTLELGVQDYLNYLRKNIATTTF